MSPRLTSADVDAAIRVTHYTVLPDDHTTVCSLQLDNGTWVHGMAHCTVSAREQLDTAQLAAYATARREVWQLIQFRRADAAVARA